MALNVNKFLDQAGVSTLWTRVAEEVGKVDKKVTGHETRITAAEKAIAALEAGTYDDSELRGLVSDNADAIAVNKAAHEVNAAAIATLNGDAATVGSVAHTANAAAAAEVAKIVANADESFDTLKEIADWILNDTTGAANMANDIAALEAKMEGIDATVVAKIASELEAALKVNGADKYALASEVSGLADRLLAIENAGYQNASQVESAIDAKIAALDLANSYDAKGAAATAETNAKAYADGLAVNYDAKGAAATALADAKAYSEANLVLAKAYTDAQITERVVAMTEAEIDAAIEAAKNA